MKLINYQLLDQESDLKSLCKTITIKRNPLGELFIFVVTDYSTRKILGILSIAFSFLISSKAVRKFPSWTS